MTIRPIESGDLPSAVELLSTHEPQRPFGIHWSEPVLARHCLGSRVGQCWVAVDEGRVRGLVSFHVLPFLARSIELVGILDIVAIDRLSWSEQTRLLDSVLATIQEQGAVLAMTIRTGDAPGWAMLRSGFIPWVRDSILTVRRLDDGPPFSLTDRPNLLWR